LLGIIIPVISSLANKYLHLGQNIYIYIICLKGVISAMFWQLFKKLASKKNSSSNNNEQASLKQPIFPSLTANLATIKDILGNSSDVKIRQFKIGDKVKAAICWIDGLADETVINSNILQPLMVESQKISLETNKILEEIQQHLLTIGEVKEARTFDEVVTAVLSGDTIILVDGVSQALTTLSKGFETRDVAEPPSEVVARGPREGFVEVIATNIVLLRRKIKNPNLRVENLILGKQTKTPVAIVFIKGIANEKIVAEVRTRLKAIDTDSISEANNIQELIRDAPLSLFPTILSTERPDTVAADMLEGRIAILVDGTPYCMVVPVIFLQFFQTPEDYYESYFVGTFIRWLRLVALLFALLLPALYICVVTYHPEVLPVTLALTIANAREGVPFPAMLEAMLMELTFELLREAGLRMPRSVGPAVSIVGALVLGEAAISAGIVSPSMVVVVAATAISSLAMPRLEVLGAIRILRFLMILLAGFIGLYGVIFGLFVLHVHLVSLRSFGVPYMSPLAPANYRSLKDTLFRAPFWAMLSRPKVFTWRESHRQKMDNMPKPPTKRRSKND
jgi:spore germination protein KA